MRNRSAPDMTASLIIVNSSLLLLPSVVALVASNRVQKESKVTTVSHYNYGFLQGKPQLGFRRNYSLLGFAFRCRIQSGILAGSPRAASKPRSIPRTGFPTDSGLWFEVANSKNEAS